MSARVPMKRYTVKCKIRGCYDSFPMNEGLATEAARMHKDLGAQHTCELIPAKHHPSCECDECRNVWDV
jgi:hypothetical protein